MNNYEELIGRKAQRITFCIKEGNMYYLLMSVIEVLELDMQDYDASIHSKPIIKREGTSDSYRYNIYMVIDWVELGKDFIMDPLSHYKIGNDNICCYGEELIMRPSIDEPPYILRDSLNDNTNELQQILPFRGCSKFLYSYIDRTRQVAKIIVENKYLQKQLSLLSSSHYVTDLSRHLDFVGNIYILRYNPYFRQIKFAKSDTPKGLYASIEFRPNVAKETSLCIRISNKNKAGFYSYEKNFDISTNKFFYFFDLPSYPDSLGVKVFDKNDNLIYYDDDMSFLSSIEVTIGLYEKTVLSKLKKGNEHQETKTDKYRSHSFSVGETPYRDVVMGEAMSSTAFKLLEERSEFFFFDGDKDNKEKNIKKAQDAVKRILSKATKSCLICDPYFSLEDLHHYVFTIESLDVDIRIIGSREFLGKSAIEIKKFARDIDTAINGYKAKVEAHVQYRLLKGKSPLHDRFIVVDDAVWLLGSSFSEFGNRATTIVKVPKESCPYICNTAEKWWADSNYTETLEEEYGKD